MKTILLILLVFGLLSCEQSQNKNNFEYKYTIEYIAKDLYPESTLYVKKGEPSIIFVVTSDSLIGICDKGHKLEIIRFDKK
jgi:hypothetical protein